MKNILQKWSCEVWSWSERPTCTVTSRKWQHLFSPRINLNVVEYLLVTHLFFNGYSCLETEKYISPARTTSVHYNVLELIIKSVKSRILPIDITVTSRRHIYRKSVKMQNYLKYIWNNIYCPSQYEYLKDKSELSYKFAVKPHTVFRHGIGGPQYWCTTWHIKYCIKNSKTEFC